LLSASYVLDPVAMLEAAGATTLWQECHLIDPELVAALHHRNREVLAWTANDEAEIERLARLDVDGICGNYPDRIRRIIERVAA
jgi:glycerophosphoryl diester phosphodiesterase